MPFNLYFRFQKKAQSALLDNVCIEEHFPEHLVTITFHNIRNRPKMSDINHSHISDQDHTRLLEWLLLQIYFLSVFFSRELNGIS